MHAAWNVGVRAGTDRLAATAALLLGAALIAAAVLPFLPAPAPASWPHLAVSMALHVLYFNLLAEAYARGGIALAYPAMRGVAPALTAAIATIWFGEHLGPAGWIGLLLICAGVALLARRRGAAGEGRALAIALGNAAVIALYTVNDAFGARASGSPFAYALWTFLLPAGPASLILLRGRLGRLFAAPDSLRTLRRGLGGGFCSAASYGLALWAMTRAPIGAIAALRETAMCFGMVFAWWFLGERPGTRGWSAVGLIAVGAVVLKAG